MSNSFVWILIGSLYGHPNAGAKPFHVLGVRYSEKEILEYANKCKTIMSQMANYLSGSRYVPADGALWELEVFGSDPLSSLSYLYRYDLKQINGELVRA